MYGGDKAKERGERDCKTGFCVGRITWGAPAFAITTRPYTQCIYLYSWIPWKATTLEEGRGKEKRCGLRGGYRGYLKKTVGCRKDCEGWPQTAGTGDDSRDRGTKNEGGQPGMAADSGGCCNCGLWRE